MSNIPENAPEPQDRKKKKAAAAAREAEATGKTVTVEQCGVTLTIPVGDNIPLEAVMAFTAGDDFGGTRALLGEEQWSAFIATRPTLGDYNELGDKLKEAAGN